MTSTGCSDSDCCFQIVALDYMIDDGEDENFGGLTGLNGEYFFGRLIWYERHCQWI